MGPFLGVYKGGPVGPMLVRVGRGVDGENKVYFPGGLEKWPEGNVLLIEATVSEGEGGLVLSKVGEGGV